MTEVLEYKIPYEAAECELEEKRSRFLGCIRKVDTEEEARAFIQENKSRYHDAKHHCWAYVLKEGDILRYSDDGEPQGTAGQPILEVFRKSGITNVCCVVTRYFGGILLGTGGLTRAYSGAAKEAMKLAGFTRMQLWQPMQFQCAYSHLESVKRVIGQNQGILENIQYADMVEVYFRVPVDQTESIEQNLTDLTSGQGKITRKQTVFCPGEREEF